MALSAIIIVTQAIFAFFPLESYANSDVANERSSILDCAKVGKKISDISRCASSYVIRKDFDAEGNTISVMQIKIDGEHVDAELYKNKIFRIFISDSKVLDMNRMHVGKRFYEAKRVMQGVIDWLDESYYYISVEKGIAYRLKPPENLKLPESDTLRHSAYPDKNWIIDQVILSK